MNNDEINIKILLKTIWTCKFHIAAIILLSSTIFLGSSYILPIKYQSSALLAPSSDQSNINKMTNQFGAIATFAGINLGDQGSTQKDLAIEILKSRKFIVDFVERRNILIPLMSSKGWDKSTNKLILDPSIYDSKNKRWAEDLIPTNNQIYNNWINNIFSYNEDRNTGYIKIIIEHFSPFTSQQWAEWIIEDLNSLMMAEDVREADLAIEFFENEVKKTPSDDLRQLYYKVIQSKKEKKMLAYSLKDYALKTIDPPYLAERKSSPDRLSILMFGLITGFIFSTIFIISKYPSSNKD